MAPCLRDEKTYDEIFTFLKNKGIQDPDSIIVDFEQATKIALKKFFPNTSIRGCLFHFGQRFVHSIIYVSHMLSMKLIKTVLFYFLAILLLLAFSYIYVQLYDRSVSCPLGFVSFRHLGFGILPVGKSVFGIPS